MSNLEYINEIYKLTYGREGRFNIDIRKPRTLAFSQALDNGYIRVTQDGPGKYHFCITLTLKGLYYRFKNKHRLQVVY
jgi:hypothetical protein